MMALAVAVQNLQPVSRLQWLPSSLFGRYCLQVTVATSLPLFAIRVRSLVQPLAVTKFPDLLSALYLKECLFCLPTLQTLCIRMSYIMTYLWKPLEVVGVWRFQNIQDSLTYNEKSTAVNSRYSFKKKDIALFHMTQLIRMFSECHEVVVVCV